MFTCLFLATVLFELMRIYIYHEMISCFLIYMDSCEQNLQSFLECIVF